MSKFISVLDSGILPISTISYGSIDLRLRENLSKTAGADTSSLMNGIDPMNVKSILAATAILVGVPAKADGADHNYTVALTYEGRHIEGRPLHWNRKEVFLLGRDGYLWTVSPRKAENFRRVSPSFESLSQRKLRAQLAEEFGGRFDVSGTGTFLVVHPLGGRDQWAQRFEDLYRSMVHYFTARGIKVAKPEFPLVAVVFHTQGEFLQHAREVGLRGIDGTVKGLYSHDSNRILVFDSTQGASSPDSWQDDFSVVIHEAAHQTACNTGLHSRFGDTPTWIVEGIGTLFEAPGVYDPHRNRKARDRINGYRFEEFSRFLPTRPQGTLEFLVSSDRLFSLNWRVAYANAWALTFYLSERHPMQLAEYLQLTANRPNFVDYPKARRLADFKKVFGQDLIELDQRMIRYLERIR